MNRLRNRNIVVTGAAGALGSAVVDELVRAGARCYAPCYEPEIPSSLRERASDHVIVTAGVDLANESNVTEFYASLPPLWASIHLAGGFRMAPITGTALDDFLAMFRSNATTCFLCCREAVRAMRAGGDNGGRIINVSGRPAIVPTAGMVAYATSKAAVASMTQCLAQETKNDGILVNAIVPSIIDTPANREAMPDADHSTWPTPEQIARTIVFLASEDSQLTTGTLIPVYGQA